MTSSLEFLKCEDLYVFGKIMPPPPQQQKNIPTVILGTLQGKRDLRDVIK